MSQSPSDIRPVTVRKPDALARRTRLREFQNQLLERMQAVRTGAVSGSSQLGVMIGHDRWLLDLKEAGEIVTVGPISQVPLTQPWYLGLTNVRGNLISVIDFASFNGQPALVRDKESRIIAFAPSLAFNSGLMVSRVMGLKNIDEMQLQSTDSSSSETTKSYKDHETNTWTQLSLSLMVQDPRFLHIGL